MNLDPESSALAAIHCQGDIIDADGAFAGFFHDEVVNRDVVDKLSGLLDGARKAGATVIYTQIAYSPDYSDLKANSPLLQIARKGTPSSTEPHPPTSSNHSPRRKMTWW